MNPTTLRYIAAATLAIPLGALAWFEQVYLWFGLIGDDPPTAVKAATGVVSFALAILWPLRSAGRPAEVVERSCRLGIGLAILLPIVAIVVLLLWVNVPGRRDLGMGGLMLYSMPVVAIVGTVVLVMAFGVGRRLAMKRKINQQSPIRNPQSQRSQPSN